VGFVNEPVAGFLMPDKAAFLLEFKLQLVGERLEIMRVIAGIFFHPLGERTARPVGFLRTFVQFYAKKIFRRANPGRIVVHPKAAPRAWVSKIADGTNS